MVLRMHDVIEPFMRLKYDIFYDKYPFIHIQLVHWKLTAYIKAVGQKKNTEHKLNNGEKEGRKGDSLSHDARG